MRGALRPAQFDVLLPIEPVFDLSFRTDKDDPLAPVDNAPLIVGKIFDAIHLAPPAAAADGVQHPQPESCQKQKPQTGPGCGSFSHFTAPTPDVKHRREPGETSHSVGEAGLSLHGHRTSGRVTRDHDTTGAARADVNGMSGMAA